MRKQSKKEKEVIDKFKRETNRMSSSQIIEYIRLSEVEKEKFIESLNRLKLIAHDNAVF